MKKFTFVFIGFFCLLITGATTAQTTLTSTAASSVQKTSATFNGTYEGTIQYTFELHYSDDNFSSYSSVYITASDTSAGVISMDITGLNASTTYKYRFRALFIPPGSMITSNETEFTTLAPEPPVLTTNIATNITNNQATLGGNIQVSSTVTTRGVCYSLASQNVNPEIGGTGVTTTTNGTGTGTFSETISTFSSATTYYFKAYATNDDGTAYGDALSFTTTASEPGSQASNITFPSRGTTTMTINWTDGGGSSRIVAIREGGQGTIVNPVDRTTYTASNNWSEPGSNLGNDYFVVYKGTGSSVSLINLNVDSEYWVEIFEFNGTEGIENYYTEAHVTANRSTLKTQPTVQANSISFDNINTTTMSVDWVRGDATNNTGVIVVARAGAEVSDVPQDGTLYTANAAFGSTESALGSGYVVYTGTGTSIPSLSGLSANTEYHFKAFEYNNTDAGEIDYLTSTSGASNNPNQQYTLATTPTQASNITFSNVEKNTMDITWTKQGDGSLVVVNEETAVATNPSDASTYSANSNYGVGDTIGTGFVVYNGTGNGFTLANLKQDTIYHVRVYSYNNTPGVINYNTNTGTNNPSSQKTAAESVPTIQAYNISFNPVESNIMTINWNNGNGTKRIIAMREGSEGSIVNPVNKTTYNASATWGDIDNQGQLGESGYYVVYNNTGHTSVEISNLATNTEYFVQIFEYNGDVGQEAYNINTASNNPNNIETLNIRPSTNGTLSSSNIKFDEITITSSGGNGEGRIIIANTTNSFTTPTDGTDYTGNSAYTSGEQIVYSGTSSSVIITGLSKDTDYYFKAFEYNNTAPNTLYSTGSVVLSETTGTGSTTWQGDDGSSPTNWHLAENWSGGIPTNETDVTIPNTTNQPSIGQAATAKSVTIEAGACLSITSGLLSITNEIKLESPSNSGMPGTIVINNAQGALTAGSYTIERYIPTGNYHYISPATSATVGSDFTQYWAYNYNETDATGSPWENLETSETLTPGKGYSIRKSIYTTPPDLLTFNGSFNNGTKTVSITNSAPGGVDDNETYGWNIVGNPYPSTIDMLWANLNWTNTDATIYVYNASSSGYTEYNTSSGVGSNRYIAPMQAFYVHVTTGKSTGEYKTVNSMRTSEESTFKKAKIDRQVVSLDITNDVYSSETYFVFFEGATETFDPDFDGYKLFGENDSIPEIYSYIGDTKASINTFPIDTLSNLDVDGCKFKLGIKKGNASALTISIKQFENIPANVDVVLIDKTENNQVSLIEEDYKFSTLNLPDDRFELHFIPTRIAIESISVTNELNTDFIQINNTLQFSAKTLPETASNHNVEWSVDNNTIGSIDVNSGLFSAKSDGTVTVKAIAKDGSGVYGEMLITVYTTIVLADSIDIWHSGVSDSLTQNSTMQFYAEVFPTTTTNQTYKWSVDNSDFATIDESSGLLSAIKEGTVTVTATSNDESKTTASVKITIYLSTTLVSSINIESTTTDSVEVNSNLQLIKNVLPTNAANNTVAWQSLNEDVAIVNQTGLVTGKSIGTATITATANDGTGVTGEFVVKVYNYTNIETTVNKGFVKFYPNPTAGLIRLESSSDNCMYTIYNSLGSIQAKGKFSKNTSLDISNFEGGIYYIEFIQNNIKQIELLIKSE